MLGGPLERSGFPPPAGSFTPPRCGLFLLRRSHPDEDAQQQVLEEVGEDHGMAVRELIMEIQLRVQDEINAEERG